MEETVLTDRGQQAGWESSSVAETAETIREGQSISFTGISKRKDQEEHFKESKTHF